MNKKIASALISTFNKKGLEPIIEKLNALGVKIYSTGGTQNFIEKMGVKVFAVEDVTSYPSMLGGRVKTLHPKIFGGILYRENISDKKDLETYDIPKFDLIIVDLYPFEETLKTEAVEEEIIEKIDIGGVALIRAAAKNFKNTFCLCSKDDYSLFLEILETMKGETSLEQRKEFAAKAFKKSFYYDSIIFNYLIGNTDYEEIKDVESLPKRKLRYGENPHQKGNFLGDLEAVVEQLNGKEISYNNLLDINAAIHLIKEFEKEQPTFAILKHNNCCGLSTRSTLKLAYQEALSADPLSAFGGVLISNTIIDSETAHLINDLFCEVIIAPDYNRKSLQLLREKKNRILLVYKPQSFSKNVFQSCLNGFLAQERDYKTDVAEDLDYVTEKLPTLKEKEDLLFASKICKHTKSNAIVLVKDKKLLGIGMGQTSRVDALLQSIQKAEKNKFSIQNAVMASDAFFPFVDCVEIAHKKGIGAIIQPGGSIRDDLSKNYCNKNNISMVFTKTRHFKH